MPEQFTLTTPVALIIFNRPDNTEKVFNEIAKARPKELLIVGDGARTNKQNEQNLVHRCRSIVSMVNWDCNVKTNYSDINLGCKKRVSSGISWVFENVSEAIILEDDCVPTIDFFRYCQELLQYYRNDERIGFICGTNLAKTESDSSYYFSRYPHIWGWASWARVWKKYDVEMKALDSLIENGLLSDQFSNKLYFRDFISIFKNVKNNKVDTWDAQVTYLALTQAYLSIFPNENLISNIGFGENATHTHDSGSKFSRLTTRNVKFPLKHPNHIMINRKYENERLSLENIGKSKIHLKLSSMISKLKRLK